MAARGLTAPDSALLVRGALPGDAPALAPLLASLGYPTEASEVTARLARLRAYLGPAVALVAVRHGAVVGLVTGHAFPSLHADAPAAWLTTLVVALDARGQGIGRQLVRAVEAWAADVGAVRISVTSGVQRDGAHRFYERLGYTATGRRFTRKLDIDEPADGAPGTGAA